MFFALFSAMVLMIGCGGGSSSDNNSAANMGKLGKECYPNKTCDEGLRCDTDNNVCVEDPENPIKDSDITDSDSDVEPDTGSDSDGSDSAPDNGDTAPDSSDSEPDDTDSAHDGGDTAPDNGDTESDDDADADQEHSDEDADTIPASDDDTDSVDPELNFPECSPTSETPCIDPNTLLVWSARSTVMLWSNAFEYCNNLDEGGYTDWRLPDLTILYTLVRNCSSQQECSCIGYPSCTIQCYFTSCDSNSEGYYSIFGETAFLWSSSAYGDSEALGVSFVNGGIQNRSVINTMGNVRCVRIATTSATGICSEIPEHAVYNTASEITLTWDWTNYWTPSLETTYNEEPSTTECRFKCEDNYFWDSSTEECVISPCDSNPCVHGTCTATNATEYSCECDNNYFFDANSGSCLSPCDSNPCVHGTCTATNVTEYSCECDNNYFFDSNSGSCLNPCDSNPCVHGTCTATNATEYSCECDNNYFFDSDSGKCLNPCDPNPCNRIGETGICVGKNANEYSCECDNNYFFDSNSASCLSPCNSNPCVHGICTATNTTEYSCECEENYFWSPYFHECMKNPCKENSCNIPNSTGICNPVNETQYSCECDEHYYWWGLEKECKNEQPSYNLGNICTGQNKCYDNETKITCPASASADFFGQDAYYANLGKCIPQSFTVQTLSSQKVVIDNNTGLMWQQTIPTEKYTWANAGSYCSDLTYAGYSDWRLPTPHELLTIVDNGRSKPAIDTTYFPDTPSSYSYFWSSSTYVHSTSYAWHVNFYYGHVYDGYKTYSDGYVRCVRGSTLPASSFQSSTVNGDEIVTDTKTGLVWQKSYVSGKNWQGALSYCETLTYAGYSDWRLPDKNELASLVNYKKYGPASDFPDMPSRYFWSSSTDVSGTSYAWIVAFNNGSVDFDDGVMDDSYGKAGNYYSVRCVR